MATIRQANRKSIHVFDLDDTLMESSARVWVLASTEAKVLKSLSTAEFTHYVLQSGEVFDFREFSDIGILSRGIAIPYTRDILKKIMDHGSKSHFSILTARPEKKMHAPFLIRLFKNLFGIELHKDLIFTISDERYARFKDKTHPFSSLRVAEKKALVIADELISKGYNDISFYDDSRDNLSSFLKLRETYPEINFKAHFIDPTWRIRLHEFKAASEMEKFLQKGWISAEIILRNFYLGFNTDLYCQQKLENGEVLLLANEFNGFGVICKAGKFYLTKIAG